MGSSSSSLRFSATSLLNPPPRPRRLSRPLPASRAGIPVEGTGLSAAPITPVLLLACSSFLRLSSAAFALISLAEAPPSSSDRPSARRASASTVCLPNVRGAAGALITVACALVVCFCSRACLSR
eukprot:scaffold443_cov527-Prasinococcus_capsulatus_cf.AAC.32